MKYIYVNDLNRSFLNLLNLKKNAIYSAKKIKSFSFHLKEISSFYISSEFEYD